MGNFFPRKAFVQEHLGVMRFWDSSVIQHQPTQQENFMKKASAAASQQTTVRNKTDAVSLLKADHRKVEGIFQQFEASEDDEEKGKLAHQACLELIVHTQLEEDLFYPACREKADEQDLLDEAQVEHDGAKVLIADLLRADPGDAFYDAKVKTLSEYIRHHVAEEEKPRTGIFAKAQKAGVDMNALGEKLQARKMELMAQSEAMTSNPPQPRSFRLQPQKETSMARYYNERDERGRFTDDDDRSGRGYQSRGGGPGRDEQGRFTSDDDRSGRGYQARDDGNGRSSRGRGWYGDSEGHSQASREGWDERGGSRSRDYDDDRGYRSEGRGHGGWYGDPQGHSQASREGWRSSSHEGSGWYGDPRGHSQASREGWEDRDRYSGRQARGRDDDDDRRSRGGRGHGGWFGDPEGHSEASREGWRNR